MAVQVYSVHGTTVAGGREIASPDDVRIIPGIGVRRTSPDGVPVEMTSRERMRAVPAGERPDRTPFFPCIYLDHAAHSTGHRFEEALADPRLGLQWMLQANRLCQSDVVRVLLAPPRSWFRDKKVNRRGERLVQPASARISPGSQSP